MNIAQLYQLYSQSYLVDTDTRKIRKGSMFFCLKGDNFNGNEFAEEALKSGSNYVVIDDEKSKTSPNVILVENVLETLQKLANFHRKQLTIPIISLTGSNGKTTTKELINAVLSKKYLTAATTGNLNNHIGVPLTLLSMTPKTEIGIVEMGANHLKEIAFLCKIAEPDFGLITNFGKAHLEGFGSFEGVVKGKSELYDFLRVNNKTVFINTDDELQVKQSAGINAIEFNNTVVKFMDANPFVKVQFKNTMIESNLIGKYNYNNIAVAVAVGDHFNVPETDIKMAIENYIPANNRSQLIQKGSNKIILDAYNANPSSMQAALENFAQLKDENKVVFLGDMFELGKDSMAEHEKIANLVASYHFSKVFLIGKAFSATGAKNAFVSESFESFKNSINYSNINNATILIKGSRGMALERLLDLL
ncbi:MAG: UDP-N-acetylmuramoyl-tripeptide--D-alanyl-D-alanine ligase [Lutibacter sp.]|nr:UDP-N-acetylmuramoyl-tripeptide--D-alanyl-D-alanine ligase [Lutibacter sp.]